MRIRENLVHLFHLDMNYSLLSVRNVHIVWEFYKLIDLHDRGTLNDLIFLHLMKRWTDLSEKHIYELFNMLDINGSNEIDFDEFHVLVCILVAVKDKQERGFIYRHSRTVFDILDEDASAYISAFEFNHFSFLFNFRRKDVRKLFQDFDVTGDQELDYREFRMFAMAAIELYNKHKRSLKRKMRRKEKKKLKLLMENTYNQPPGEEEALADIEEEKSNENLNVNNSIFNQIVVHADDIALAVDDVHSTGDCVPQDT